MLFLDGLNLLLVQLHSCFLCLEQIIENSTTPLSVDLQDSTDGGLFRRQLGGQMLKSQLTQSYLYHFGKEFRLTEFVC